MKVQLEDMRKCSQYDKLLLNGNMHWQFLDSWLFTDWKDSDVFPGKECKAEGVVLTDEDESYAAQLLLVSHDDLNAMSLQLYLKKDANASSWDSSVNITSIEKEN